MAAKKRKKSQSPGGLVNRRARYDYELSEDIVAGLELTGPEVRAARDGHVTLRGGYVSPKNNELWLTNASFSLKNNDQNQPESRTVDDRPRRLLAKRKQIDSFMAARTSGMSIIPTKLITNGRYIKLVIALGKGKKNYDKRQTIKKRDQDRDTRKNLY